MKEESFIKYTVQLKRKDNVEQSTVKNCPITTGHKILSEGLKNEFAVGKEPEKMDSKEMPKKSWIPK